jgi:hypothetical protein
MSESEYIVWKVETRSHLRRAHPDWDEKKVRSECYAIKKDLGIVVARPTDKDWIRLDDRMPPVGEYVLLSFLNHSVPDIGYCKGSEEEGYAIYSAYDNQTYLSRDCICNAWMPLPDCLDE